MEALSALAGVVLGFILKSGYDFFIYQKDRKDRYFFSLIEKRFEVYQSAHYYTERIKSFLHHDSKEKRELQEEVINWYHENCLYLRPELRDRFKKMLFDYQWYNFHKDHYFQTVKIKDSSLKKVKRKAKN